MSELEDLAASVPNISIATGPSEGRLKGYRAMAEGGRKGRITVSQRARQSSARKAELGRGGAVTLRRFSWDDQ